VSAKLSMATVALVELDDASHDGQGERDAKRDASARRRDSHLPAQVGCRHNARSDYNKTVYNAGRN
jgi:hypothetical protein